MRPAKKRSAVRGLNHRSSRRRLLASCLYEKWDLIRARALDTQWHHRMNAKGLFKLAGSAVFMCSRSMTHADEGMWLFNDPPRQLLKERHGFEITDAWLEHVQKSSVRFNS